MCPYGRLCEWWACTSSTCLGKRALLFRDSHAVALYTVQRFQSYIEDDAMQYLDRLLLHWFHMPLACHVDKLDDRELEYF